MAAQMTTGAAEANERPRRLGRSAVALAAGFVVGVVLSVGTDIVFHVIGIFPALGQPMGALIVLAMPSAWLGGRLRSVEM